MKNKNLLLKLRLIVVAVGGFSLSFTSATLFHLNIEGMRASAAKDITDNMMYVHFADNGNDFGGFLYFSNGSGDNEDVAAYQVGTNASSSDTYNCRKKIKGFYYNAERGERLWPLDDETWKSVLDHKGVQTTGGIYANCVGTGYAEALEKCRGLEPLSYTQCVNNAKVTYSALGFGFYGSVNQTYSGKHFNLTIGVEYKNNGANNFISIDPSSKLAPTFERIDNKIPVGFVYDYNGGVGLAGCRFTNPSDNSMRKLVTEYKSKGGLSRIFEYDSSELKYAGTDFSSEAIKCDPMSVEDTLLRILIEGIVGMNEGGDEGGTRFGALGNSSDIKMQYFGTRSVDTSTLMNYAIKKAELLCRGRWTNSTSVDNNILCFNNGGFTGELAKLSGKTLIVKNGNVTIKPFTGRDDTRYYDIYLLNGDLIIDESEVADDAGRFVFNKGGFISSTTVDDFSGAVHSALCPVGGASCEGSYDGDDVSVGSFIRGNFVVNGEVKGAGANDELKNKYFIYGKFTTMNDTFNSLERKFSWTCENGFGSDGNYCPKFSGNPYRNAALVVIDQNYESSLLK